MVDVSEALAVPLTIEARVEPQFIDAMGHMNVAWYVHLFDRAVWAFFARHGLDEGYRERAQAGMFALEENVRYLSELRLDAALEVRMGVLDLRPKTLRLYQYMVDPAKPAVSAVREVVAVHIDLATRRSKAFPDEVSTALRLAPQVRRPGGTMTEAEAQSFAHQWIDSWNRRDIEAVLAHFADDAVFVSPKAEAAMGHGRIVGKNELRRYWLTVSGRIHTLQFALDEALWNAGAQTLTIRYRCTIDDQPVRHAVEIMRFAGARIVRGEACYGATVDPGLPA